MTAHELDRRIEVLARRQHGVFHQGQAVELGATRRMIERRRDNGQWVPLAPRVFALPGNPGTWLRQAKAAELSVPGSALSGRSAAVLHDLGGLRPGRLEITVGRDGLRTSPLATVRRRDDLASTIVKGVRVLTVGQTLCNLAGGASVAVLERSLDDALVKNLATISMLVDHHATMVSRRTRGAVIFGALLEDRATGYVPPSNALEAALYRTLADPRLPEFKRQHGFAWHQGHTQIVDAYLPAWRRIIEADGRRYHARLADFERDRSRDHAAQVRGIEVTRFTYRQLMSGSYALDVLLAIGAPAIEAA